MKQLIMLTLASLLVGCQPAQTTSQNIHPNRLFLGQKVEIDLKKAAELNVELGLAYFEQGQIPRAKKKLLHALELDPHLPQAHLAFGHFYEHLQEHTSAEKYYLQAIQYAQTGKGAFHNNYAAFLCRQEQYERADKYFRLAVADKNYLHIAAVFENAGLCAQHWQPERAIGYLKKSIAHDPKRISAYMQLAKLYQKRHQAHDAKNILTQLYTEITPTAESLVLGLEVATSLPDDRWKQTLVEELEAHFSEAPEYQDYLSQIS